MASGGLEHFDNILDVCMCDVISDTEFFGVYKFVESIMSCFHLVKDVKNTLATIKVSVGEYNRCTLRVLIMNNKQMSNLAQWSERSEYQALKLSPMERLILL